MLPGHQQVIAALRRDGSPRISAREVQFEDGEVRLGMMGGGVASPGQSWGVGRRLARHAVYRDPRGPVAVGDTAIAAAHLHERKSETVPDIAD